MAGKMPYCCSAKVRHRGASTLAILKIARMGHPVLRQPAERVADPSDPAIARLVADMSDTLADAGGVGLAAPQVHVSLRVVIYFLPGERTKTGDAMPLRVLINPVITPVGEGRVAAWEGCLSVPGLRGVVSRPETVRLQAQGLDGSTTDETVSGFHARVLQHECDHLDGVLYPQRMDDLSLLMFQEELRHGPPPGAPQVEGIEESSDAGRSLDGAGGAA